MVVDVRYHLASLVGVFFALGLGILIGTSINSDDRLVKEQASIIDNIEAQLSQLRFEKEGIKTSLTEAGLELKAYETFAGSILPTLVDGRLSGHTIAVVGIGTARSEAVIKLLRQSGATITGTMQLRDADWEAVPDALDQATQVVVVLGNAQEGEPLRRVTAALKASGMQPLAAVEGGGSVRTLRLPANTTVVENVQSPLGLYALVDKLSNFSQKNRSAAGGE